MNPYSPTFDPFPVTLLTQMNPGLSLSHQTRPRRSILAPDTFLLKVYIYHIAALSSFSLMIQHANQSVTYLFLLFSPVYYFTFLGCCQNCETCKYYVFIVEQMTFNKKQVRVLKHNTSAFLSPYCMLFTLLLPARTVFPGN